MDRNLQIIDIAGEQIPISISVERRKNLRVSFGREVVNIRIPNQLGLKMAEEQFIKAKQWITSKFSEKPQLFYQYAIRRYDKTAIKVYDQQYKIDLERRKVRNGSININQGVCIIKVPQDLEIFDESRLIKALLSRGLSKRYISDIENEVESINREFFQQKVNSVRLKYNKSNWGSCSSKGNINLSSRLLLVPNSVRRYVIIHELSHLIEMNHSSKFWAIVREVDPLYKSKEKWLSDNGEGIDF